jgi:hypothetical protein
MVPFSICHVMLYKYATVLEWQYGNSWGSDENVFCCYSLLQKSQTDCARANVNWKCKSLSALPIITNISSACGLNNMAVLSPWRVEFKWRQCVMWIHVSLLLSVSGLCRSLGTDDEPVHKGLYRNRAAATVCVFCMLTARVLQSIYM